MTFVFRHFMSLLLVDNVYHTEFKANKVIFLFYERINHNQDVFIQQEISRHLRPTTLRALYGKDKVKNAVHCTDMPEDGVLEVGGMSLIVPAMDCRIHPHYFICVVPLILHIGFLIVFQSMHK